LKVNGLIENPKWKNFGCTCQKIELSLCTHCRYEIAEKSIPSKDFKIQEHTFDKNGKITKTTTRTIKEISLVIGSHDDVVAWSWI